MRDRQYSKIKQDILMGNAASSVTVDVIERLQAKSDTNLPGPLRDEIAWNVTSIAYGAAVDTTTIATQSFLIAMTIYPEVQKRGQAELDRIVGPDRLPDFSDEDDLVYVRAIVLEALRWMVVLPLGVYHRVICDDEYKGYLIPKGATIISNTWAMLHDPEDYPNPSEFRPERFIKDGRINPAVRDPVIMAFGFGRRICPGRYLAQASLFIAIASILHSFNVQPSDDGKKFDPFTDVATGSIA